MQEKDAFYELVARARLGNKECLDELTQLVEPGVCAYIQRVMLYEETTNDITQETLLTMVESIGTLRKDQSFRPWLFRIASNKITDLTIHATNHQMRQYLGSEEFHVLIVSHADKATRIAEASNNKESDRRKSWSAQHKQPLISGYMQVNNLNDLAATHIQEDDLQDLGAAHIQGNNSNNFVDIRTCSE